MAKANEQVIQAFLDGKRASGHSLFTDGTNLWSYDYLLAWHYNEPGRIRKNLAPTGILLQTASGSRIYDAAYSPTTSRHRRLLAQALSQRGYDTHAAEPIDRDTYEYRPGDRVREYAERYGRDEQGIYRDERSASNDERKSDQDHTG